MTSFKIKREIEIKRCLYKILLEYIETSTSSILQRSFLSSVSFSKRKTRRPYHRMWHGDANLVLRYIWIMMLVTEWAEDCRTRPLRAIQCLLEVKVPEDTDTTLYLSSHLEIPTLPFPSGGRPLNTICPRRYQHILCRRGLSGTFYTIYTNIPNI